MSGLLFTILAALAEFERELINLTAADVWWFLRLLAVITMATCGLLWLLERWFGG